MEGLNLQNASNIVHEENIEQNSMKNDGQRRVVMNTMLVTPNHQPLAVINQTYDPQPVIGSSSDVQVDKECQMYFGRRLHQIYNGRCPSLDLDDPKDIRRREIEYDDSSLSELIIRADNEPKFHVLDEEDLEYEVAEAEDNEGEGEPNAPPSVFDSAIDMDDIDDDLFETDLVSSDSDSENDEDDIDDNIDDDNHDNIDDGMDDALSIEIIGSVSDEGEWVDYDPITGHVNGVYPVHDDSTDDEVEELEIEDEQSDRVDSDDSEDVIIISNDYPQPPQQTIGEPMMGKSDIKTENVLIEDDEDDEDDEKSSIHGEWQEELKGKNDNSADDKSSAAEISDKNIEINSNNSNNATESNDKDKVAENTDLVEETNDEIQNELDDASDCEDNEFDTTNTTNTTNNGSDDHGEEIEDVDENDEEDSYNMKDVSIKIEQNELIEINETADVIVENQPSQSNNDTNNNVEKEDFTINANTNNKRRRNESETDMLNQRTAKKACSEANSQDLDTDSPNDTLCRSIESEFPSHNSILKQYIDKTSNSSGAIVEQHCDILKTEIHILNEKLLNKELEWNALLHKKKVKEEILTRLQRKQNIMTMLPSDMASTYQVQQNASNPNFFPTHKGKQSTTNSILQNRVNMDIKNIEMNKQNLNPRLRNIFPKPPVPATNQQSLPILTSIPSTSTQSLAAAMVASASRESSPPVISKVHQNMMNGHNNNNSNNNNSTPNNSTASSYQTQPQIGRQGVFIDVSSLVAAYRKEHPETVPRRGRRMKNINSEKKNYEGSSSNINIRSSTESRISDVGLTLSGIDANNSRTSSTDSSPGNSNNPATSTSNSPAVSFKDVLVQFAKMSQSDRQYLGCSDPNILAGLSNNNLNSLTTTGTKKQAYPEVTLHPVTNSANNHSQNDLNLPNSRQNNASTSSSSSLLHDFLTKTTSRPNSGFTSYSPTLARLLTTPDRISSHNHNTNISQPSTSGNSNSQITITPVVPAITQQSMLQKQLQQRFKTNQYLPSIDDDADDSTDRRLVIDEGDTNDQAITGREIQENDVPKCQGCGKREARFVCAGCSNQWYCSKDCQVLAWDEHSDICTG